MPDILLLVSARARLLKADRHIRRILLDRHSRERGNPSFCQHWMLTFASVTI